MIWSSRATKKKTYDMIVWGDGPGKLGGGPSKFDPSICQCYTLIKGKKRVSRKGSRTCECDIHVHQLG